MLSQIQRLSQETEGRYASDEEIRFLAEYTRSFELRVQTYQKLQACEATIVQQVQGKIRATDPTLFRRGNEDVTAKCRQDIILALRYSTTAMLIDDPESMREQLLFWLQTIVRAFNKQKISNAIYTIMQDVIKQVLTPNEASLILPILEMNRRMLGTV
ncbi:MAG: phycobilisome protein [Leptolyngbya sp. Prado105]|jgi:hypothetical protein|nr:phycobilisome protein [Leptolyngbya sp. Prado105]